MWKDEMDRKYNILTYITGSFTSRAERDFWGRLLEKIPRPILVFIFLALLGFVGFLAWGIYYLVTEVI